MSHTVPRSRQERLAHSPKPFVVRGLHIPRCKGCRLLPSYCMYTWRPWVETHASMCLVMHDIEALEPTNTGWLTADTVADTFAFGWSRTEVDPRLLELLADLQWQPYLVFPGEYVAAKRVVNEVAPLVEDKQPLFILLNATWTEACEMFRKSPYLEPFPVLGLLPEQLSRYRLRHSTRGEHLCTAEVMALYPKLAGDEAAGETLGAYLEVFGGRYLGAKRHIPLDEAGPAHRALAPFHG